MTKREQYEAKVEAWLLPVLEEHHFELVDVEYVREVGVWYLRAYIDKEGGEWLDKEDFIDDSYILEVSSPGLGRPLKKEKDFVRSMGKDVEVRLYKPLNKQKEYTGALKSYDADTVTITLEDGNDLIFAKADIALIRLAFDF